MIEFLVGLGLALCLTFLIFGAVGAFFYLVDEGLPDWANPFEWSAKRKKHVLEYIEWERSRAMKNYPSIYPTEAEWNDLELERKVRSYDSYDRKRMLAEKGNTKRVRWVMENDPSVLKSRIQELEKELGIK